MRWRERRRIGRAAIAVACGLIAALVLSACVAGRHGRLGPRFVTPPLIHYTSVLWPVPLQLVGVEPGRRIRLEASLDTRHGRWRSSATYTVPASGTVDLATAKPQLAAFTEPDSAGLFWSLRGPDIDPAVLVHLARRASLSIDDLDELLNRGSGLLGLSGRGDMRDVRRAAEKGDANAQLALDTYVHRLKRYIGAYLAELGGLDVLTFTAGVGENDAALRADALAGLEVLGIRMDAARNQERSGEARVISTDDSPVTVLVVPTNEELEIGRASCRERVSSVV